MQITYATLTGLNSTSAKNDSTVEFVDPMQNIVWEKGRVDRENCSEKLDDKDKKLIIDSFIK